MNASGYLCRFFDYISIIPMKDKRIFISELLTKADPHNTISRNIYVNENSDFDEIVNFIDEISQNSFLSLRDLTTLLETYHIMIDVFFKKYQWLEAKKFYFFLLFLKYKRSNVLSQILAGRIPQFEINNYLKQNIEFQVSNEMENKLEALNRRKLIKDISFTAYNFEGVKVGGDSKIRSVSERLGNDRVKVTIEWDSKLGTYTSSSNYNFALCLNNILFLEDI